MAVVVDGHLPGAGVASSSVPPGRDERLLCPVTAGGRLMSGEWEGSMRAPLARGRTDREAAVARLTSEQVWRALAKASFAVVSHTTPTGEPRSSGVVYATAGRRLYAAVAADSWKARHIAASGRVA